VEKALSGSFGDLLIPLARGAREVWPIDAFVRWIENLVSTGLKRHDQVVVADGDEFAPKMFLGFGIPIMPLALALICEAPVA